MVREESSFLKHFVSWCPQQYDLSTYNHSPSRILQQTRILSCWSNKLILHLLYLISRSHVCLICQNKIKVVQCPFHGKLGDHSRCQTKIFCIVLICCIFLHNLHVLLILHILHIFQHRHQRWIKCRSKQASIHSIFNNVV